MLPLNTIIPAGSTVSAIQQNQYQNDHQRDRPKLEPISQQCEVRLAGEEWNLPDAQVMPGS